MNQERLGLHSHILPALKIRADEDGPESDSSDQYARASVATIFDCRHLPKDFVEDTGSAAMEELVALRQRICLPFANCYFEFQGDKRDDNIGIIASTIGAVPGGTVADCVDFNVHAAWSSYGVNFDDSGDEIPGGAEDYGECMNSGFGKFTNGIELDPDEPREFLEIFNCDQELEYEIRDGATMLIGILTLMNEKLIATELRPDPAPRLNSARIKRGRLPLSAESHVLTINVAAVRRIARKSTGTHESPRLHWRRGHRRVLHRGSEFESSAWVKRCLVGDPARGYIHKDYRVIWTPPMLEATP